MCRSTESKVEEMGQRGDRVPVSVSCLPPPVDGTAGTWTGGTRSKEHGDLGTEVGAPSSRISRIQRPLALLLSHIQPQHQLDTSRIGYYRGTQCSTSQQPVRFITCCAVSASLRIEPG